MPLFLYRLILFQICSLKAFGMRKREGDVKEKRGEEREGGREKREGIKFVLYLFFLFLFSPNTI